VRINAGSIKDKPWVDERLARGEVLRQRARAALESLHAHVQTALA
jgi:hypothetical protein